MTQVQQGTLLEVLKKKMRALKDELEQALEQADEFKLRMLEETRKREEVSSCSSSLLPVSFFLSSRLLSPDFQVIRMRPHVAAAIILSSLPFGLFLCRRLVRETG